MEPAGRRNSNTRLRYDRAVPNFSGGSAFTKASAIAGTTDDALYHSERYGSFSYEIPTGNGAFDAHLQDLPAMARRAEAALTSGVASTMPSARF